MTLCSKLHILICANIKSNTVILCIANPNIRIFLCANHFVNTLQQYKSKYNLLEIFNTFISGSIYSARSTNIAQYDNIFQNSLPKLIEGGKINLMKALVINCGIFIDYNNIDDI